MTKTVRLTSNCLWCNDCKKWVLTIDSHVDHSLTVKVITS